MRQLTLILAGVLVVLSVGAASARGGEESRAACGNTTYQGLRARAY